MLVQGLQRQRASRYQNCAHFSRPGNWSHSPLFSSQYRVRNSLDQGRPTFFTRGPNLVFQKFRGPKFNLTLSSAFQTTVFRWVSWWSQKKQKKKRSSLRFVRFFLSKSRWRLKPKKKKKKVFTQILSGFSAKKQVKTKKKVILVFCGILLRAST